VGAVPASPPLGQRRPPEQEQVLPPGLFRLRYAVWTHAGHALSASEQKIVDELSTRGVQVWTCDVVPSHPLRQDDVVVLTSLDDDDGILSSCSRRCVSCG
jgi:hypothetical protein